MLSTCMLLSTRVDRVGVAMVLKNKLDVEVTVVTEAIDFLNLCEDERYKFLIIEAQLPKMNGIDLAATLRSSGIKRNVFLLCENYGKAQYDRSLLDQCGVLECLFRPLKPDIARAQLRTHHVL